MPCKIFRVYYVMNSRELRDPLDNIVLSMEIDLSGPLQKESLEEKTDKKAVKTIYAQLKQVR